MEQRAWNILALLSIRSRVDDEHRRSVVWDAVDLAVGGKYTTLPLVYIEREAGDGCGGGVGGRVDDEHSFRTRRNAVNLAIGCKYTTVPLAGAAREAADGCGVH